MNDMQILIEQMVSDISGQAVRLDDLRLQLFLNWLNAHSNKVKTITILDGQVGEQIQMDVAVRDTESIAERLKTGLRGWFACLPMQGLLWEYHIILDEITWWRDLDHHRLVMIMGSEERQ